MENQLDDLHSRIPIQRFVLGERHFVLCRRVLPQPRQGNYLVTDTTKSLTGLAMVGAEDSRVAVSLSIAWHIFFLSPPFFLTSL